ncbi:VCBS repeat-containing protein [bacterium]|nr:VCBS repeat-containing protein [bacterium]
MMNHLATRQYLRTLMFLTFLVLETSVGYGAELISSTSGYCQQEDAVDGLNTVRNSLGNVSWLITDLVNNQCEDSSKVRAAVRYCDDPDLEPGFPVQCLHSGGSYHAGPAVHTLVGNIDTDQYLEIVVSALATGPLYAWKYDGSIVSGWPLSGIDGVGYAGLGNLGDGPGLEIFSGHWGTPGQLVAYDGSGSSLTGWPIESGNYVTTPPALADMDGDGFSEIFVGEENWRINAYHHDGTVLTGWPVYTGLGTQEIHTPALADLDGDGDLEIITASGSSTPGVYLFGYHHDGSPISGFPILFPKGHPDTFACIGDVDGDFEPEIVVVLKESAYPWRSILTIIGSDGLTENSWFCTDTVAYGTAPALADLDGDIIPEIVVQTNNALDVWSGDGTPLPGWPVTWTDRSLGNSSPVVGDVDGDLLPDIVITTQVTGSSESGEVRVFDRTGVSQPNFPKSLAIGAGATPAIADVDQDGRNEIVVSGSYWNLISGYYDKVWVYDLGGDEHGPIQWGQFGGGPDHTGAILSAVTLTLEGDQLSWNSVSAATGYDVIRGDLNALLSSGGDFSGLATSECLADNSSQLTLDFIGQPSSGEAYWFLVRPVTSIGVGTYDAAEENQVQSRDQEINASVQACS